MKCTIKEGNYAKMGAYQDDDAIIFTFEGEKEQECVILLYYKEDSLKIKKIAVPSEYCIGSLRSIRVQGIEADKWNYNYEIDSKIVVDPYAVRIVGRENWFETKRFNKAYCVKSGFDFETFDWKDDENPEILKKDMIMYKLHIRGFTMDGGCKGDVKGTFAGVGEKISYLRELGVTSIEMLPVYEFEEMILPVEDKLPDYVTWKDNNKEELVVNRANYWGYVSGNYFAPKASYAKSNQPSVELKNLIYELHQSKMECILEMYFDEKTNQNLIMDALRFWVKEYHVDGFHLIGDSVPVKAIVQDLVLRRTKLFYTGFDAELLELKKENQHLFIYNDEFLYPIRKIMNHMGGNLTEFVNQMKKQHPSVDYVNYIANNNGFTLADVFMYSEKHNEANGENNSDGNDWNFSCNYGVEGYTRRKYIQNIRKRQIKNALAIVLLAQGIPLILSGDEFGNSQKGNNNTYCQDNNVGWINWKMIEKNADILSFMKKMSQFRSEHPIISMEKPMRMTDYANKGYPDLSYHCDMAWVSGFEPSRQAVGIMYCADYANKPKDTSDEFVYIAYNFHSGSQHLALPKLPKGKKWNLYLDTSQSEVEVKEELASQSEIEIEGQTVSVLVGR